MTNEKFRCVFAICSQSKISHVAIIWTGTTTTWLWTCIHGHSCACTRPFWVFVDTRYVLVHLHQVTCYDHQVLAATIGVTMHGLYYPRCWSLCIENIAQLVYTPHNNHMCYMLSLSSTLASEIGNTFCSSSCSAEVRQQALDMVLCMLSILHG